MYGLLFNVKPKEGYLKHYLKEADKLNPILATYPGLKWIDRFSSLSDSRALLSLQIWDSKDAISAWKHDKYHLQAQDRGKKEYFQDYRIRIGREFINKLESVNFVSEEMLKLSASEFFVLVNSTKEFKSGSFVSYKSINRKNAYVSVASTRGIKSAIGLCTEASFFTGVISSSIFKLTQNYSMKKIR